MEISALALRLLILFIPGIVAALMYDYLVVHQKWSNTDLMIRSFLFGVLSYMVLQIGGTSAEIIVSILSKREMVVFELKFWGSLTDANEQVPFTEILLSTLVAIVLSLITSKVINAKWIIRFAQYSKISQKHGDDSLWSYFLNSGEVQWVWIRYPELDILYEGSIQSFSDSESVREIVLQNVRVYRNSNTKRMLYEIPAVYLSGKPDTMIIELIPENDVQQ